VCRHVAYLGPPVVLASLLLDPPHALATQARAPRHQDEGVTNVDGWGVAWWDATGELHQHRSTVPLPDDAQGRDLLRRTTAGAFVAAVRRASPGLALEASGNAPFVAGGWAFSLNGFVGGWIAGAGDALRTELSPARRAGLAGDTDTEVLFGLVLDRVDAGAAPGDALAATTAAALAAAGDRRSKLNLLLADGARVWATRHGNSLFERPGAVASEPWDDDPAWREAAEVVAVAAVPTD
jgi:glutamine amidotransferase